MMNQVGQGLGVMFGFGRTKIWHASSFYLTARSSYCNSNSQIQFHNSNNTRETHNSIFRGFACNSEERPPSKRGGCLVNNEAAGPAGYHSRIKK
jgi:hypothetical protein